MADWRLTGFVEERELGRGAQGRVVLARHAGTGAPSAGVAPGGSQPGGEMALRAQDRETQPPGGQATSAGGGYGVGSERGSGGSGEGTRPAGDEPETDWLRDAPGGPPGGSSDR